MTASTQFALFEGAPVWHTTQKLYTFSAFPEGTRLAQPPKKVAHKSQSPDQRVAHNPHTTPFGGTQPPHDHLHTFAAFR